MQEITILLEITLLVRKSYPSVSSNKKKFSLVFFIRDPQLFPDLIHTQKRNPQSNLKDPDAFWDFLANVPESVHQVLILFSDRGTPLSFRHMHGFGSHTYKWVCKKKIVFIIILFLYLFMDFFFVSFRCCLLMLLVSSGE